jgi:hypothetical protein
MKPPSLLSPSNHSKMGLRDVIVPSKLMGKFMSLAQQNTDLNVETCGILAGTLVSFVVIIVLASIIASCFGEMVHDKKVYLSQCLK